MSNNKPVYYFAYGSNLSFAQMRRRCPSSRPLGLAFLRQYTFIINGRGYANVVQNGADDVANDAGVYGVVYKIGPDDEASLDRCEGVPYAYTKEYMSVDFVRLHYREDVEAVAGLIPESEDASDIDGRRVLRRTHVLVYIDRERTSPGPPQPEYVERMSRGVEEASRLGLPKVYVTGTIGRWIPRLMIPTIYTAAAEDLASSSTA
ncbi:aig2 family protein [Colletotrichum kahawae]|uniref:gamma-glutamylcyclotransferase n=1 Tax=Colletotrichum kahawae TaxID=34407 RepID=A0AAD9Y245_COLKA|nr:aig2 family protein [Colletotrichum kahawae]